jgi:hypothetical protein
VFVYKKQKQGFHSGKRKTEKDFDPNVACVVHGRFFDALQNEPESVDRIAAMVKETKPSKRPHACPHCLDTFTEARSRDHHVRVVHEKRRDHNKCISHPRLWASQVSAGTLLAVGQFPAETKEDALPCSPILLSIHLSLYFCFIRAPLHRVA